MSRPPLPLFTEQMGMIVHELVNNAARHAFNETGGEVRVEINRAGNYVECRVSDNGAGLLFPGPESGLRIVRELVAIMGGRFELSAGVAGLESTARFPSEGPLARTGGSHAKS